MTFKERCAVSQQSLPESLYRDALMRLHDEMLTRITELEAQVREAKAEALKEFLSGVTDELEGYWSECSGCHETLDGHPIGNFPYIEAFRCHQGGGCDECGGIGVVWNQMTDDDIARLRGEEG